MRDENICEEAFKFVETIPFDELFSYIKQVSSLNDLSFNLTIKEDRYGFPLVKFRSQDLVDRVGFLTLIFKSLEISNFNSEVVFKTEEDCFIYWCTVHVSYTHPDGGSNGKSFMHAVYKHNTWSFNNYEDDI